MWKCSEVTYYFYLVSVLYVDKKIVPQVYLETPNTKNAEQLLDVFLYLDSAENATSIGGEMTA